MSNDWVPYDSFLPLFDLTLCAAPHNCNTAGLGPGGRPTRPTQPSLVSYIDLHILCDAMLFHVMLFIYYGVTI